MVTFHLRRQVGYYIMDYYVPSMLLVIISWVSFWLDANAISGRINLGQCYLIVVFMISKNNFIYLSCELQLIPHSRDLEK